MAVTSCPHCGHESEDEVCPLCGSEMPVGADPGGSAPGSPPGEGLADSGSRGPRATAAGGASGRPPGARGPVAWEDPAVGFPANAWQSWRESLFEPTSFFRRIDHAGSMARPVLYFLLVSVVGAFFHLVWQAYLYLPITGDVAAYGGGLHVVQFFATPFAVLFFLGIQTLILHLFVLMLAPDHRGIGSTARVICYASGPALLSVVPFVGALAGGVWGLVLQVVGVREAHRTSTGRAVVSVLGPLILAFAIAVFLVVLMALTVGQGELATIRSLSSPLP